MNSNEAEIKADELVKAIIERKELSEKINEIKGKLLEYAEIENINDFAWAVDNGLVEVITETKYKLADVPAEIKISTDVAAVDIAEKAFESKVKLTKEGKRLFHENHPAIVRLMIPHTKKSIKVTV